MIPDLALIVVAGGSGTRFGAGNKLLTVVAGKPVFLHSLLRLGPEAAERILVVPESLSSEFRAALCAMPPEWPVRMVFGGAERSDSVRSGLDAVSAAMRMVAIHDAARPLADAALLRRCCARAREVGGAIPGHPLVDTVKLVGVDDDLVAATPPRALLRAVGTPQVFRLAELREACRRAGAAGFTDDAAAMEAAGFTVAVVPEESDNRKLTYPEDLEPIARALSPGGEFGAGQRL